MKYYTYIEPKDPDNNDWSANFITLSEKEILDTYWDYWYSCMCKKFTKEYVDSKFSKQDCIDDWCIIHWAQLSD